MTYETTEIWNFGVYEAVPISGEYLHYTIWVRDKKQVKERSRMKKVSWEFASKIKFLYITCYYSGKIQESLQYYIVVSTTSESIEDKH